MQAFEEKKGAHIILIKIAVLKHVFNYFYFYVSLTKMTAKHEAEILLLYIYLRISQ
jgi:hypothetical protein